MTFTYLAPDKRGSGGNVALEARSRRGVGKADVTLDTAQPGWTASGGGDGLTVSGLVADVGKPFELSGTFPGGTAQLTYTPTSGAPGPTPSLAVTETSSPSTRPPPAARTSAPAAPSPR